MAGKGSATAPKPPKVRPRDRIRAASRPIQPAGLGTPHLVRELVGYLRYDTAAELDKLKGLGTGPRLRQLSAAPQKLLSKQRRGAKVTKKHDAPATPHQRANPARTDAQTPSDPDERRLQTHQAPAPSRARSWPSQPNWKASPWPRNQHQSNPSTAPGTPELPKVFQGGNDHAEMEVSS